jgi:hypothetical protein
MGYAPAFVAEAHLMRVRWTATAKSDLARLYEFLAPLNRHAAARAVQSLRAAPSRLLLDNPAAAFASKNSRPGKFDGCLWVTTSSAM